MTSSLARTLATGALACALCTASNAFALVLMLNGPASPIARNSGVIFDKATTCGLVDERLLVSQEAYSIEPVEAADKAEIDAKVTQIAIQAGLGSNPAKNQITRQLIREMLVSRMLLTLTYEGEAPGKMACLTKWLESEGYSAVTSAEADKIRQNYRD